MAEEFFITIILEISTPRGRQFMCIQKLQPSQRTQGLFSPSVGRYSWRLMLQRFSSFSTKFCCHVSLYLLDSDCLTSLLFYSQSFLDLSSSCQLFPFFLFSLFNFSSSCFLHLSSFLFKIPSSLLFFGRKLGNTL